MGNFGEEGAWCLEQHNNSYEVYIPSWRLSRFRLVCHELMKALILNVTGPCVLFREVVERLAERLQVDGQRIVEAALQLEADEEGTDELPGQSCSTTCSGHVGWHCVI